MWGGGPFIFHPDGRVEVIIIPFPVMPLAPMGCPAGAGVSVGIGACRLPA